MLCTAQKKKIHCRKLAIDSGGVHKKDPPESLNASRQRQTYEHSCDKNRRSERVPHTWINVAEDSSQKSKGGTSPEGVGGEGERGGRDDGPHRRYLFLRGEDAPGATKSLPPQL